MENDLFPQGNGGANPTSPLQFRVRKIDKLSAVRYFQKNHYTKTCSPNPYPCYGIFFEQRIYGALAFAVPISENVRASVYGAERKEEVIELHRMFVEDSAPKNTESWFIGKALKFLNKEIPVISAVISYSDPQAGHIGTIYKASNFKLVGKTGNVRYYMDKDGVLRCPRQKTHIGGKRVSYNVGLHDAELRGWAPIERGGKSKWLYEYPTRVHR